MKKEKQHTVPRCYLENFTDEIVGTNWGHTHAKTDQNFLFTLIFVWFVLITLTYLAEGFKETVGPIGGAIFIIGGFVYSVSLIPQALTVLYCMYTDPKELRSRGLGRILMLVSMFGTIMLVLTVLSLEYGQ